MILTFKLNSATGHTWCRLYSLIKGRSEFPFRISGSQGILGWKLEEMENLKSKLIS
jgi:hypothetical protein